MVSRVLIYTVDQDVDSLERTGMKKETDRGVGRRTRRPPWLRLMHAPVQGRAAPQWPILIGFGSYGSGAMWRAHFAYLEVVVVGEVAGGNDLPCSSLGDGVGGL
jgi:hypothetical protein